MNKNLRSKAEKKGLSLSDYILKRNREIGESTGINRTIFAACPNSIKNRVPKYSNIKKVLWSAVISSGRWNKWLNNSENSDDFYSNDHERQEWLVKTGCRYIWQNPEVVSARMELYQNLENNGIKAEEIVLSNIEKAMDKYFYKFNLVDLHDLLKESTLEKV